MIKTMNFSDPDFQSLTGRMEGAIELLIKGYEIIAVTTASTPADRAPSRYWGVIFYKEKA